MNRSDSKNKEAKQQQLQKALLDSLHLAYR